MVSNRSQRDVPTPVIVERAQFERLVPQNKEGQLVKTERNGTVIPGADRANQIESDECQVSFDLQPEPAALRDLAVRFREDAETVRGSDVKEHFLSSAEEAEAKAQVIEASALWTAPVSR